MGLQPVSDAILHDVGLGLGEVGIEVAFSLDVFGKSKVKFDIKCWLEHSFLSFGAFGNVASRFVASEVKALTSANGLDNVMAMVAGLLDMLGDLFHNGCERCIGGGAILHSKLEQRLGLGRSLGLLGIGALLALS